MRQKYNKPGKPVRAASLPERVNTLTYKELMKRGGLGPSRAILAGMFLSGVAALAPQAVAQITGLASKLYEGIENRRYKAGEIERALRYLRSRKLIDIQKQYGREVFKLTKLGWLRTRKLMKSFAIRRPEKWDGKWRIVVFDIPTAKKSTADLFRYQLKNMGLANLQKSIWIHPYECRDQVYYLAGNLFIKPYVRYIVAEEVAGEEDLKWRFGL